MVAATMLLERHERGIHVVYAEPERAAERQRGGPSRGNRDLRDGGQVKEWQRQQSGGERGGEPDRVQRRQARRRATGAYP